VIAAPCTSAFLIDIIGDRLMSTKMTDFALKFEVFVITDRV